MRRRLGRFIVGLAALAVVAGSSYVLWAPPSAAPPALVASPEPAPAPAPAPSAAPAQPAPAMAIAASAWQGLQECTPSAELLELQNRLLASAAALRQTGSERVYRVSGEFLGLPVTELEIGVCERTGTRDCGWGAYLGLIIDLPLAQARQQLLARTGIDYTEALRDEEAEATLRPLLSEAEGGRSRLSCDPGTL